MTKSWIVLNNYAEEELDDTYLHFSIAGLNAQCIAIKYSSDACIYII